MCLTKKMARNRGTQKQPGTILFPFLFFPPPYLIPVHRRIKRLPYLPAGNHQINVADPDSFFTDPDPGIFSYPDPGSGSRQKTHFFKGNNKILGEIFVFNPRSRYFIFVFNQKSRCLPILLNREL